MIKVKHDLITFMKSALMLSIFTLSVCGDGNGQQDAYDGHEPDDTGEIGQDVVEVMPDTADVIDAAVEDIVPQPMCPPTLPSEGAPCEGTSCIYMVCDDFGVGTAICDSGQWSVTTEPCSEITCSPSAQVCEAGQICVVMMGGALIAECVENSCGEGPITCECISMVSCDCTFSDLIFTCNTCEGEICA